MSGSEKPKKDDDAPKDMSEELREIMKGLRPTAGEECAVEGCSRPKKHRHFCEECAAAAKAVWDADEAKRVAEERAEKVDEEIARMIGKSYTRCTWDNLDTKDAIKDRIRRAVSSGGSVIMTGRPGVGKTHTMTCIFRDVYLSGATCEVWACADLFDRLRSLTVGDDPEERKRFLDHFRTVDWIFLDDLGVEKGSEFVLEQVFRIIDWRSRDESPVVVTSNLTMEELGQRYDRRFSSRLTGLAKCNGGFGIKFEGRDHRKGGK